MKLTALAFGTVLCAAAATPVTFHKDVEPVLQAHCQECHRPGEIGPFTLMSYKDTRPLAKSIKEAVLTRKMPPWLADPKYGHFANDRSLSKHDLDTLVAWADTGAVEGDLKDAPKPREFVTGWQIGKPDVVLELPKPIDIPATGVMEYMYLVIPTGFTEDRWIQAAEARPEARSAVHHVVAFMRPKESRFMRGAVPGVPYIPKRLANGRPNTDDLIPPEVLIGWAPGLPPLTLNDGQARLVPAGADIVLQLHYTPNGTATTDRTRVGLTYAKQPPKERVISMFALNYFLKIPPGEANYESRSHFEFKRDVKLVSLMPHMHLRGKDFEFQAVYPTGERQVLLNVPQYDFNWQLVYVLKDQLLLPKGTRIECVAHHDNSANNKFNPDASKEVRWGDQTFEEMMIGWFDIAVDATPDPKLTAAKAEENSSHP